MNDRANTPDTVRGALANAFGGDPATLPDHAVLRDDLGADSLAIAEVLAALERELGVELPDSNEFMARLQTVGDVVQAFEAVVTDGAGGRS
jgi:acyl carrier protein